MTVYGVSFDLIGKQPIVLLKTADDGKFLPIWIGHAEAAAILLHLQGQEPQRPMTHDLACALVASLGGEITKITVTELKDNTFYASITVQQGDQEIDVDSRTSDAIAIAIRADAKIYAADAVVEESAVEFEGEEPTLEEGIATPPALSEVDMSEFRSFLDSVSADEFRVEDEP